MTDELVSVQVERFINRELETLGIKNYIFNISPATARGDNYLGLIAKVQVKGNDNQNKKVNLSLIVKSAPGNCGYRKLAPIHEVYLREAFIYSRFIPEITKFQDEKRALTRFESFAKYYSSVTDDLNEAIMLEDMKELGFKLVQREESLDLEHILLVMKEYGKLHALSFALRDQKPALFEELSQKTQEAYFSNLKSNAFYKSLEVHAQNALKLLDPLIHKAAYEQFESFQCKIIERLKAVVKSDAAGQHGVINHGDCWVYNMLFKYENSLKPNVPTKLCLLDWQLSRLGSPALDLSYFLFMSSDKNVREGNYDNFIKVYYNSLSGMMRELGSDPEKLFPFSVLQEHLRKFSVFGLCMAIIGLYLFLSDADQIPDIYNFKDEQDMVEQLQFKSRNISKYNDRISNVILDFVSYGYEM